MPIQANRVEPCTLYRAWHRAENKLRPVTHLDLLTRSVTLSDQSTWFFDECDMLPGLGKKDKTGEDIFAGDVILFSKIISPAQVINIIGEIVWKAGGFSFEVISPYLGEHDTDYLNEMFEGGGDVYTEVIGNIYQDPEY